MARKKRRVIWLLGIMIFLLIFIVGVVYYYRYADDPIRFKHQVANVQSWLSERKQHMKYGLTKINSTAHAKRVEEEPVQFEFYTALPNMQVPKPVVAENIRKPTTMITTPEELERELARHIEHAKREKKNDI